MIEVFAQPEGQFYAWLVLSAILAVGAAVVWENPPHLFASLNRKPLPANGQEDAQMPGERKNTIEQNVTVGANNSGTVSPVYNNTVSIGTQPKVELVDEPVQEQMDDGTYRTGFRIRLTGVASRLTLIAEGDDILDLGLTRPAVNGVSTASFAEPRTVKNPDKYEFSFSNASGEYLLWIDTRGSEAATLKYVIQS
ncbi:MAG: hypothetical protein RIE84_14640 [Parvibaculum sp.]|uniref:hypothetical protein n=1 Tax=Parvibaculum sp. TaxID=2024848 RepID=UPI0032EBCC40